MIVAIMTIASFAQLNGPKSKSATVRSKSLSSPRSLKYFLRNFFRTLNSFLMNSQSSRGVGITALYHTLVALQVLPLMLHYVGMSHEMPTNINMPKVEKDFSEEAHLDNDSRDLDSKEVQAARDALISNNLKQEQMEKSAEEKENAFKEAA